jgi:hypothetical protein
LTTLISFSTNGAVELNKSIFDLGVIFIDIAVYLTLLFSLIISTLFSISLFKKKASKWLGVLTGFCINSLLLSVATIIFYKVFNVKEVEGLFASLGILIFTFFIPIFTCINFYILEFLKYKNSSVK